MPYKMIFKYADGNVGEIKPLANDNPASELGVEDSRIVIKNGKLAGILTKRFGDLECSVEHY